MTIDTSPLSGRNSAAEFAAPDAPLGADMFGRTGSGPLAGLLVADFGRVLAAPYCTMLLADMGATVVKIESPGGDDTRSFKPPVRDGESTYYLSVNRNKGSISLDLQDAEDRRIAQEIAGHADVVVENFKPNGLTRFDLDYDTVAATNPDVVYASITGFGTAGGASLPGYDLLAQAMSGLMSVTGSPETPGYRAGFGVFDVVAGMHAAIGILGALQERQRSGKGQRIEVNLMSSALSGMVNQTAGYVLTGSVPTRVGNAHPSIYPYEPLATGEGDIIIGVGNDSQFRRLCQALGMQAWATDERFATNHQRSLNREALRPMLQEVLSSRSSLEWFDILTEAGIPCGPINDVRQGLEFAERIGLDPVVEVGTGESAMPGIRNPIIFSETPVSYDMAPPEHNAHREPILAWLRSASRGSGFPGAATPAAAAAPFQQA
jgi:crotonobetainyl-CoA:carnitine CoA-transferase CaiB-like acyl-CoA transferase